MWKPIWFLLGRSIFCHLTLLTFGVSISFHTLSLWLSATILKIIIWGNTAAVIPAKCGWVMTLGKGLGTARSPPLFLKVVAWRIQEAIKHFAKSFLYHKWPKSTTFLSVLKLVLMTKPERFTLFTHFFIIFLVLIASFFFLFSGYWWALNI